MDQTGGQVPPQILIICTVYSVVFQWLRGSGGYTRKMPIRPDGLTGPEISQFPMESVIGVTTAYNNMVKLANTQVLTSI